jgi:hypothetical protein
MSLPVQIKETLAHIKTAKEKDQVQAVYAGYEVLMELLCAAERDERDDVARQRITAMRTKFSKERDKAKARLDTKEVVDEGRG